jgi:threonine dehydrogenase-like Zn-dependent dehydrogenase
MIKSAAGGMVNVALECTGFESSIRTAIFVSHATKAEGPEEPLVSAGRVRFGWKWRRLSAFGLGPGDGEQKRLVMDRAHRQSLKFGGKCFVIGVGPTDQGVSHSYLIASPTPQSSRSPTLSLIMSRADSQYPFGYCSANQISLDFLYRYSNQYPKAIRVVSGGLIDLKPLVTHRFPLNRATEAFEVASDPSKGAIKVQITD